jgi:hypothetical protein
MASLNLQELNRQYYDPEAAITTPREWEIPLKIWPGYQTSISRPGDFKSKATVAK